MFRKIKKQTAKFLLFAAIIGTFTTLITGLFENSPLIKVIDTGYYGYPVVWRIVTLSSNMELDYVFLAVDILFWSAVSFVILEIIKRFFMEPED
jgi:hypothetical protein